MLPKIKALPEGVQGLYSKNATAQGQDVELDTVLDKTSFQGYRRFKLVYSLAHNSPRPFKEGRCFKASLSAFVEFHQPDPPSCSWPH